MLAKSRKILIQFLYALLMRFDSFALETFFELR